MYDKLHYKLKKKIFSKESISFSLKTVKNITQLIIHFPYINVTVNFLTQTRIMQKGERDAKEHFNKRKRNEKMDQQKSL